MSDAVFAGNHHGLRAGTIDDKKVVGMFSVDPTTGVPSVKLPGKDRETWITSYENVLSQGTYGRITLHKLSSNDDAAEVVVKKTSYEEDLFNEEAISSSFFNKATGYGFMSVDGVAAFLALSPRSILMARASQSLLVFTHGYAEECMFLYEHQIAQLATTLMSVLEYLRSFGVYYYDIKPANVLVYTDGTHLKFRLGDHESMVPCKYNDEGPLVHMCTFPIAAFAYGRLVTSECSSIASHIYTYIITVSIVKPLMLKLLYVQRQIQGTMPIEKDIMPCHFGMTSPETVEEGYADLLGNVYSLWSDITTTILNDTEAFPYASNARDFITFIMKSVVSYFEDVKRQTDATGTLPCVRPLIVAKTVPSYQQLLDTHISRLQVNERVVHKKLGTSFTDYDASLLRASS